MELICFRAEAIIKKPKVISHNGNSGKYPAATSSAYYSAIDAGVDYIDCIVQISKDNVPFCRPTPNLIDSTDVSTNSNISQQYLKTYPGFYGGVSGIFTFDLTWDQISPLRGELPEHFRPWRFSPSMAEDANRSHSLKLSFEFSHFLSDFVISFFSLVSAVISQKCFRFLVDMCHAPPSWCPWCPCCRRRREIEFVSVVCAAIMVSPYQNQLRDQNYNGQFGLITLAEFLSIAKNNSKGALIGIEVCVLGWRD